MIADAQVRLTALDPRQSFIVQAPAGSGKTELLTQRYLNLLAHAERDPEEIIAITFTRKAAAEMRERIFSALQRATDPTPPATHHQQHTWQLAQAVLQRDQQQQWQLLNNAHRLRITTIDSLCANLTRQLPLLSGFGKTPEVTETPERYYQQAAKALLSNVNETVPWQKALITLLRHVDNRVDRLQNLLVSMLMRREQWLDVVQRAKQHQQLRMTLEGVLQSTRQQTLDQLVAAFPASYQFTLLGLLQFARESLSIDWSTDAVFATPSIEAWQWLADWLLTAKGEWRKAITYKQGFPDKNKKPEMVGLIQVLAETPGFLQALQQVLLLPPAQFESAQWQVVDALLTVLPIAVAHLKVIFQQQHVVDFNEIALAALQALGQDEAPSDLALSLDYQVRHLLVDEFQDTSQLQFRLLQALTRGWQSGDGRTLFLVGDPMQSIYRFRQADVGLFVKVIEQGVGTIVLTYLALSCNFRADPLLVNWFNQQFPSIFPAVSNALTGAVHYCASEATHSSSPAAAVEWVKTINEPTAKHITAKIVETLQRYPTQTIAILVRSRSQLRELLPALQQAQVPYQAVEVENLIDRSAIQDVLALTFALAHLGDRTAWLSVLRAPWCALDLADLLTIAQHSLGKTIWQSLQDLLLLQTLSAQGQQGIATIVPILQKGLAQAGREHWRTVVESVWHNLQAPRLIEQAADIDNVEAFFAVLDRHQHLVLDREQLLQSLQRLNAQNSDPGSALVQVMTIHKSKGLEFDTVILPDLSSSSGRDEPPLLLWQESLSNTGEHQLLLSPISSAYSEQPDSIYQYLWSTEQQRAQHELQRLFYVAVTRAKKRLYLGAQLTEETPGEVKSPRRGSFLALLKK